MINTNQIKLSKKNYKHIIDSIFWVRYYQPHFSLLNQLLSVVYVIGVSEAMFICGSIGISEMEVTQRFVIFRVANIFFWNHLSHIIMPFWLCKIWIWSPLYISLYISFSLVSVDSSLNIVVGSIPFVLQRFSSSIGHIHRKSRHYNHIINIDKIANWNISVIRAAWSSIHQFFY